MKPLKNASTRPHVPWGTALLVTAAFIGPGTVSIASKAGATTGYQLLWAVLFSVVATCILQTMAAKLGLVSGSGINAAIHKTILNKWLRRATLGLILIAIIYGNSAYQTGNLLGAVSGLSIISGWTGFTATWLMLVMVGGFALFFVWAGGLGVLQKILMILVALMSVLFVAAAIGSGPDLGEVANGFIPRIPETSTLVLVIGLIGTTVVPYNLFLHASAVAEQWKQQSALLDDAERDEATHRAIHKTTWDTILSVSVGGVITAAILIAAASVFHESGGTLSSVRDVAQQLKPTVGPWAEFAFALGLLAAGITSAITAPIAAGYCAAGCFGWPPSLDDRRVKLVATLIIVIGINIGTLYGSKPLQTIILAQVANGLVLPLVAVFLIFVLNQKKIMGRFTNRWYTNLLGGLVVLVTALIASKVFYGVWQTIQKMMYGDG